ncbi:MAG: hypothetical protein KBD24_04500 [Candidatus Pacebacteria bacterium]|nr:hypothetical protein [Candidatus Paceibacterota bacterium]
MPEDSSVERLKKKLYAREGGPLSRERRELHEEDARTDVSSDWMRHEDIVETRNTLAYDPKRELEDLRQGIVQKPQATHTPAIFSNTKVQSEAVVRASKNRVGVRVVKTIFFASLAFFLLATTAAVYFFWLGNSQVTCDKITFDISGPMSVPSGKELVLNVGIANENPVALQDVYLTTKYPDGTRSAADSSIMLPTTREQIGTVDSGERVRTSERAVLFGKEQSEQKVQFTLEYTLKDSSATFTCPTEEKTVLIATAPVALSVNGLEEVSSGQELVLTIQVRSNSEETVPDQRLVVEYPFGYQYVRAEPPPTEGNGVWDIGDMGQGAERTITVHGVVQAQTTEARVVRFSLGEKDQVDAKALATTMQLLEHPLMITRPFLTLDLVLNGSVDSIITTEFGQAIHGKLRWRNAMQDPLYDVEIEAVLPEQLIDKGSVDVDSGFFRSVDQTMLWTPQTDDDLREVAPGSDGVFGFTFNTKTPLGDTSLRTPSMEIAFTVRGRRVSDNIPIEQTLVSQARRTIRFVTDMNFTPRVVYSIGPFVNTGAHPPRVDKETTYTIIWNIANNLNNLSGVQVHGQLPVYVTWLGKVDSPNESVYYNPTTREVAWQAGDMSTKIGEQTPPREVAFQVALIPSITQLGDEVSLIEGVVARGVDVFTGNVIERTVRSQTTKLGDTDPRFQSDRGEVAR